MIRPFIALAVLALSASAVVAKPAPKRDYTLKDKGAACKKGYVREEIFSITFTSDELAHTIVKGDPLPRHQHAGLAGLVGAKAGDIRCTVPSGND